MANKKQDGTEIQLRVIPGVVALEELSPNVLPAPPFTLRCHNNSKGLPHEDFKSLICQEVKGKC